MSSSDDSEPYEYGTWEYLYNEPTVEAVQCFHIYEIVAALDDKRFYIKDTAE